MVLLRSLGFAFLAFRTVAVAAISTRNPDVRGRLQTKSAFLDIQGAPPKDSALVAIALHDDVVPHDDQVPVRPGKMTKLKPIARPRAPPGLLIGIFGALSVMGIVACERVWKRYAFQERYSCDEDQGDTNNALVRQDSINPVTVNQPIDADDFGSFASEGELDVYTCMALSLGRQKTLRAIVRYLPQLVVLFFMQIVLGILLMMYQTQDQEQNFFPTKQGHLYRFIGTILFAYSAWVLYESMHDECRHELAKAMRKRSVSAWYEVPVVLGETLNTFISCSLLVTLFLIFCNCSRPRDLLMACLAINFVADVDNYLVDGKMTKQALDDLRAFLEEWGHSSPSQESHPVSNDAEHQKASTTDLFFCGVLQVNKIVRMLVPFMGCILTFLFAFMHDEVLCRYMRKVEPWPFCLGVEL